MGHKLGEGKCEGSEKNGEHKLGKCTSKGSGKAQSSPSPRADRGRFYCNRNGHNKEVCRKRLAGEWEQQKDTVQSKGNKIGVNTISLTMVGCLGSSQTQVPQALGRCWQQQL